MKLNYCRNCGKKLEEAQKSEGAGKYCENCGEFRYKSPDPSAGVIVLKAQKALIIKRSKEPNAGKLSVPAGFQEYTESPQETAVRELEEETSLKTKPENLRIVNAFQMKYSEKRVTPIIFAVDNGFVKGKISTNSEIKDHWFMSLEEIINQRDDFESEEIFRTIQKTLKTRSKQ